MTNIPLPLFSVRPNPRESTSAVSNRQEAAAAGPAFAGDSRRRFPPAAVAHLLHGEVRAELAPVPFGGGAGQPVATAAVAREGQQPPAPGGDGRSTILQEIFPEN